MLKKFKWSKVASLALDGHKYSEYISHLQDVLQTHGINFIMNRKFPMESPNMSMVCAVRVHESGRKQPLRWSYVAFIFSILRYVAWLAGWLSAA